MLQRKHFNLPLLAVVSTINLHWSIHCYTPIVWGSLNYQWACFTVSILSCCFPRPPFHGSTSMHHKPWGDTVKSKLHWICMETSWNLSLSIKRSILFIGKGRSSSTEWAIVASQLLHRDGFFLVPTSTDPPCSWLARRTLSSLFSSRESPLKYQHVPHDLLQFSVWQWYCYMSQSQHASTEYNKVCIPLPLLLSFVILSQTTNIPRNSALLRLFIQWLITYLTFF